MSVIIFIVYVAISYHCLDYIWYSRRIYFVHDGGMFIIHKLSIAIFAGWAIIPIYLLFKLFGK